MKTQPEPEPPGEDVPPGFAAFLSGRRDLITRRWIEAVRRNGTLGAAKEVEDDQLADHLPKLFADLCATLRGQPVEGEAKGDAEAHGEHRWRQHYELEEVLEELGIVSRVLLAHGLDAFADAHPDTPKKQLRGARERILRFFEDAAAGSVRQYVQRSSQQLRENDLTLSEQRRLALDSAQMGWWHLDLASKQVRCDERFRSIFGIDQEEVSYDWIFTIIHPDDRARIDTAVQAAVRPVDPTPYSVECRLVRGDGSLRWVTAQGQAIFEGEGAVSMVGTVTDVTEARMMQDALRESEARHRQTIEGAQLGTFAWDLPSRRVHWNTRLKEMFFLPADTEMSHEVGIAHLHPEDRELTRRAVENAIANRASYQLEYRAVSPTGEVRWMYSTGYPIVDSASGEVTRVQGVAIDITAQKDAQLHLRELADAMPQMVWSAKPDGVLDYTNRRWYEYIDRAESEISPADWGSHVHPDDLPRITEVWGRSVATGAPYNIEFRIKRADGEYRWFLVRALAIRDGAGKVTRWYGTCTDIHDQKTTEAALVFERHQLELIFRESPAAMTLWRGEDLVFARVNPAYQDVFHGRQLVGLPLLQACPELVGQGLDDLLRRVLHTGEPFTGREFLARIQRDKDGPIEDRYFDFTYLQVRDPEGRPWGVYDHAVDVTDRVRNRMALEQSQNDLRAAFADRERLLESERLARAEAERISRVKDEFLATLSHELRTPLNAILGWTQVLRGDPANTEDMEAGLATIERNSRAQTQIIEDLLDMSKIISGKVRLDVQALDLDQVVTAAVDTMRPAATLKAIRLQVLIDPQARMISGDPNRLQQVFWNLLSNAIKFTPKEGQVQVVLERVNSHLEVSIADTGEGIAAEFLPYVFDRFRQQDASTTRRHGGLGLGLAIVKQLVELHGGSIRVESAGPGQGTTFKVLLPLSVVQPTPDPADPDHRHPQSGSTPLPTPTERLNLTGVRVLVVDDEADARALVQRLLQDRGALVQSAGSVAEAMEQIQSLRPDVLVSDIGMPGEDGYALIRQVRALSPEQGGNTPAIALTAYARSEDRLKVILASFQMHLAKPVEAAELLALVASLAGRVAGHQ